MRRFILCLLVLAGCFHDPARTITRPEPDITMLDPGQVDERFRGLTLGSLPYELGYPCRWAAFRVRLDDGTHLTFLPLDAEDEHRYLVRSGEDSPILAIGFQEPNWVPEQGWESASTYQGWAHIYDLKFGMRRISTLFEHGGFHDHTYEYPPSLLIVDALNGQERFDCLTDHLQLQPELSPLIHVRPNEDEIRRELAGYVQRFFLCTRTSPALP